MIWNTQTFPMICQSIFIISDDGQGLSFTKHLYSSRICSHFSKCHLLQDNIHLHHTRRRLGVEFRKTFLFMIQNTQTFPMICQYIFIISDDGYGLSFTKHFCSSRICSHFSKFHFGISKLKFSHLYLTKACIQFH